ncbi:hypothetical protein HOV44_gp004 [Rheinheimera phage Barba5S]|uniref:Uncharacterized protein n=2 Tax=Barbavirus TaxID=2733095 RepID=A0A4V1EZB7_9CAUD|nr:hypothetical protein HOV44_gp004 [Rheinheimera phage Barba5S]YP_009822740.1 hypothetical protein HOV45_gp004 [Rheinheimera phage Barba8S]QCQ59082.1 hypothetical protein Barba5S_gp004 [Rheinheimera phage Barba5S]QCQ59635.1 hypothetical protein Barba8S_gp004 [Rheinheimera phage Barba8S]
MSESDTTYGFVAEPHRNGHYFVNAATSTSGEVTCYDLAGFLGSWKMKDGGVFFPSVSGESFCPITLKKAQDYATEVNNDKT